MLPAINCTFLEARQLQLLNYRYASSPLDTRRPLRQR